MIFKIKIEKEVDIKYLLAEVGARYWEDAEVNGVEDVKGDLIPCRIGDAWRPMIDIETGQITNWEKGKTAKIHYKSCDNNTFSLIDDNQNSVISIDGYVVETMYPGGSGYGDYVIMNVDEDGFIEDWEFNIDDFIEEND